VNMRRMVMLSGLFFLLLLTSAVSNAQTDNYEKMMLFTLHWGTEKNQIGYRDGGTLDTFSKIGPTNFTVTSNNLVWVYDVVQNSVKAFRFTGEPVYVYTLKERAGTDGYITSDTQNNVWFHDATNRRILVLDPTGELQRSITYSSRKVLGSIVIRDDKPVMATMETIDQLKELSSAGFDGKPEFRAQLINADPQSIYNPKRGVKTHRLYNNTPFSIMNETAGVSAHVVRDGETVKIEGRSKDYFSLFNREDMSGNFYVYMTPQNIRGNEIPTYILKFNEKQEQTASIELPVASQRYGFASNPIFIDDAGTIYFMMVRSDAITFYQWSHR
jgi:hypothetical protein